MGALSRLPKAVHVNFPSKLWKVVKKLMVKNSWKPHIEDVFCMQFLWEQGGRNVVVNGCVLTK